MSSHPYSPKNKRFSRQGFAALPNQDSGMAPNDATVDIPLEPVYTNNNGGGGGLRTQNSMTALRPSQTNTLSTGSKKKIFNRGRRVKGPQEDRKTGHVGYDGEEDTLTAMGKIYDKILNFSIVTRYFLYVLPLAALIAVPIIVGATAAKKASLGGVRIVWFFSWVEVVWVSLWASKIVAHFLPVIFQLLAGVVSSGVRKYSMVIRALEIPLSLVGWSVASLATFIPIMTRNPTQRAEAAKSKDPIPTPHWEDIVNKILAAAVIASLIFLAEKLIIQLISIDYHRKQFSFRIKESKNNVYLLSLLYEASRSLFPSYCNEFAEEDYAISDQLDLSLRLGSKGRSHARSGSATPMRVIHDVGRFGDKITSVFGNVAHEITGKDVFNPNSSHSIVVEALERNRSSEALARRIWMSFVVEGREALYQEDITDVLGADRKTEAEEAFAALDGDGNGDISLDEMILTVAEIGRERKAIATSMHDVDQAINVLDRLLCVVVLIAVVFVFVAFLNASFTTTLATTGTALLSLSFVFSATCQEVLGSCIFVFVKHPFDVGDRVDLNEGNDQFTVEHISLLFTVFRRASGVSCGRICQIPNIVLNTLWIENISRSKAMSEQLQIAVSFDTSFDDLQILKNELQSFVTDKDNSRDFMPQIDVGILGTSDQSKLMLQVDIRHKSNWANESIRQARRSKFMCALVSALKAVPIYPPGGGGEPQGSAANPNYNVAIADDVAKHNAETSADAKDQARLVPLKKIEEAKGLSPTNSRPGAAGLTAQDNKIVDALTSRNPAIDPARDNNDAWTSSREDSSTLGGERQSIDRQDLEDVRGLLRRESTRGKRKPGYDAPQLRAPGVPTISEPSGPPVSYNDYAPQPQPSSASSAGGRGYQSTGYSSSPTAYTPKIRNQPPPTVFNSNNQASQSQPPQIPPVGPTSPVEMRQVISRNPSNPYRKRSESIARKPLSPTAGTGDRDEGEFENSRPYSGV